jgi:hypothetical protein
MELKEGEITAEHITEELLKLARAIEADKLGLNDLLNKLVESLAISTITAKVEAGEVAKDVAEEAMEEVAEAEYVGVPTPAEVAMLPRVMPLEEAVPVAVAVEERAPTPEEARLAELAKVVPEAAMPGLPFGAPGAPALVAPPTAVPAPELAVGLEQALSKGYLDRLLTAVNEKIAEAEAAGLAEARELRQGFEKIREKIEGLEGMEAVERKLSAVRLIHDLINLLKIAGAFKGRGAVAFDATNMGLVDINDLMKQVAYQATKIDFIDAVIYVENEEEFRKEVKVPEGMKIIELEEGQTAVEAFSKYIEEDPTIDAANAALATSDANIEKLEKYLRDHAGRLENVFSTMMMNVNDKNISGQEIMLPAMNLMSIMLRLTAAEKPTVMCVGEVEPEIMDTIRELQSFLKNALNVITIQALNIGRRIEQFINTIVQTEIAL